MENKTENKTENKELELIDNLELLDKVLTVYSLIEIAIITVGLIGIIAIMF